MSSRSRLHNHGFRAISNSRLLYTCNIIIASVNCHVLQF